LLLALALAACSPKQVPSGPDLAAPRLAEDALVMADGTRLALSRWRPDGAPTAVILGLHGFNDYAEGFALPGRWFARQGMALYAYDQRGFGRTPHRGLWPGTGQLVGDLATAVELIRQRHPETPVYLLGVSMGGAAILSAAGRGQLPEVAGAVLAAPAVWASSEMPFYQRWALWISAHTVPGLELTGAGLDRLASSNIPMLRALGRDPYVVGATRVDAMYGLTRLMTEAFAAGDALDAPTLALYGQRDEIVPPEPTAKLWWRLRARDRTTLALYRQGWHMLLRDLQAPTVWRDIAAWIDRGGRGPLPSAADGRAAAALSTGRIRSLPRPGRIRAGVR
jgi:alpha-beta hydrolase superfamily lysophospholipase